MVHIVCVGEGMVELSRAGDGWQVGYGGDALNTAIHLARLGYHSAFLTALGSDPCSVDLRKQWHREGLDCSMILAHPTRQVGLYAIDVDERGERRFAYWRGDSAARSLFSIDASKNVIDAASRTNLLHFSLISLAVLPETGRRDLIDLAQHVRAQGGKVSFDGNYRPLLWRDRDEALHWGDRAISIADIGLPTLDDETELSGLGSPREVQARWRRLGCHETVVKMGRQGCLLPDGSHMSPKSVFAPVDTSGAGDAFDAGYLAARLAGRSERQAAARGHEIAAWTIMRAGAIPCRDEAYPA